MKVQGLWVNVASFVIINSKSMRSLFSDSVIKAQTVATLLLFDNVTGSIRTRVQTKYIKKQGFQNQIFDVVFSKMKFCILFVFICVIFLQITTKL